MPSTEHDVLTSLPDKRPTRRSAKRTGAPGAGSTGATKATAARKAKPKATPKPKAKPAKPAKPVATTKPAASAKRPSKIGVPKGQSAPGAKTRVREELPPESIPAAGWASNEPPKASSGGFNTDELMGTALTAVTQIAQIGLSSINHSARSLLDKLPRP